MNSGQAGETEQMRFGDRARPPKKTACGRLLDLFRDHPGEEIPLPRILALQIAQYNTRIKELRAAGHVIENRTEYVGAAKHSWFRYRGFLPHGKTPEKRT